MKTSRMKYSKKNHEYLKKRIQEYNAETLTQAEELELFQNLVDTGLAWQMGEDFKELANGLIYSGQIERPPSGYGGKIPTVYQQMIKRILVQ